MLNWIQKSLEKKYFMSTLHCRSMLSSYFALAKVTSIADSSLYQKSFKNILYAVYLHRGYTQLYTCQTCKYIVYGYKLFVYITDVAISLNIALHKDYNDHLDMQSRLKFGLNFKNQN